MLNLKPLSKRNKKMASGKNSFVLYTDLIHTVKKMSDSKAGELFKTILSYVNDENPIIEDLLIEIAFEPIKQALKRDLKKWEGFIDKQSYNGKLGGRPKKALTENPSLLEKTQPNPKNPSLLEKTHSNPLKPKKAVSVSVIDTVSEITVRKDDYKKEPPPKEEFMQYVAERCATENKKFDEYKTGAATKYDAWVIAGWRDGYNNPISNWKSKVVSNLQYFKSTQPIIQINKFQQNQTPTVPLKSARELVDKYK